VLPHDNKLSHILFDNQLKSLHFFLRSLIGKLLLGYLDNSRLDDDEDDEEEERRSAYLPTAINAGMATEPKQTPK
jgi:hypothetical protein